MLSFQNLCERLLPGATSNTGMTGHLNSVFGVGRSLQLPTPTIDIPTHLIDCKINKIFYTRTPICVVLSNGMVWRLNKQQWDFLREHGREPREGAHVNLELYLDGSIKSVSPRTVF